MEKKTRAILLITVAAIVFVAALVTTVFGVLRAKRMARVHVAVLLEPELVSDLLPVYENALTDAIPALSEDRKTSRCPAPSRPPRLGLSRPAAW